MLAFIVFLVDLFDCVRLNCEFLPGENYLYGLINFQVNTHCMFGVRQIMLLYCRLYIIQGVIVTILAGLVLFKQSKIY